MLDSRVKDYTEFNNAFSRLNDSINDVTKLIESLLITRLAKSEHVIIDGLSNIINEILTIADGEKEH